MRFVAFALALAVAMAMGADTSKREKLTESREQSRRKQAAETLSGVVDQKNGNFVIVNGEEMKPIAVLHGRGFKDTNFARFVGLKVQVTGELVKEDGRQILYVRSLSDIKEIE